MTKRTKKVELEIYESRNGKFFVHPVGHRFNYEARFDTRAEAAAYIRNPPPAPRILEGINIPGLNALGKQLGGR